MLEYGATIEDLCKEYEVEMSEIFEENEKQGLTKHQPCDTISTRKANKKEIKNNENNDNRKKLV